MTIPVLLSVLINPGLWLKSQTMVTHLKMLIFTNLLVVTTDTWVISDTVPTPVISPGLLVNSSPPTHNFPSPLLLKHQVELLPPVMAPVLPPSTMLLETMMTTLSISLLLTPPLVFS